ncbi:MAG: PhoH family protein [Pseudomonadota bacterium]|jgi:phosphate starvation-inducible PhoH-like protein|nr:phosphate starvation-inducible protein PhoH [Alphaproteobacteria bacterium]MCS5597357.1 PhoH family protein [Alphaproteobacteria bacterium]MEC7703220.1 PhoH family protein [Pseudomonadota bacterium]|tara:strand:- start:5202 stop:6245 length:1044 start_codon:yes stop_codon:yes gene_type:complete
MTQDIEVINSIKHSQSGSALCLEFDDNKLLRALYGPQNENLNLLEKELNISISDRGNVICISGESESINFADQIIMELWDTIKKNKNLTTHDIDAAIRFARANERSAMSTDQKDQKPSEDKSEHKKDFSPSEIVTRKKKISARTPRQSEYIESLKKKELVFGIGPAGTGKTYLAVGMAVEMFERQMVDRMIFCRPAVEAGEKLGFLPGDLKEKVDPYIQPIYDALYDFIGSERTEKLLERGEIEIAPLAFMRGRTLAHAFVVLDEAQNTTSAQMKMFLSRMGEGSRMVVNGDPHQTDLLPGQVSGLTEAIVILEGIEGTSFTTFTNKDVVRHKMVQRILEAYDRNAR